MINTNKAYTQLYRNSNRLKKLPILNAAYFGNVLSDNSESFALLKALLDLAAVEEYGG
jgi:hypothetical protein